mgnify:CR=1 FL=1
MRHGRQAWAGGAVAAVLVVLHAAVPVRGQVAPPAPAPAPANGGAPPAGDPASTVPEALSSRVVGFFYPHDVDGKRIAIAEGKVAILRGQDQVDLVEPVFTLFRDVEGSPRREKIVIRGATGLYDLRRQRARLEGRVTVRQEDGTELGASALDLDVQQKRLSTEGRIELRRPGLILTGTGLEASEILNVIVLRSSVILNVRGGLGGLFRADGGAGPAPGGGAGEMVVTCDGPATLARLAAPRPETGATQEMRLARSVVVTRHEPAGLMRLSGDAATIDLCHGAGPGAAEGDAGAPSRGAEVRRAVLTGRVRLVDAQGLGGSAHRLVWSAAEDRLELSGESGVRVARGVHVLEGRQVTLERREARAVCQGDAQMTFVPEGAPGAPVDARTSASPWTIRCDELTLRFTPDLKGMEGVEADGGVTIAGEVAGAAGSQAAEGDRFVWSGAGRRGLLTGRPVRMTQGAHRMEAARVVFFPFDQRVVLQGPKRIALGGDAAGADASAEGGISLTARGDIAVSAGDGVIEVGDGAQILSPQTSLEAGRLRIRLAPGGGVERALGWERVRLTDRASGTAVFGDHLAWDVRAREFLVEGLPFACILQRGVLLQGQAVTLTRQPDGLRCANRSGLRGRIRIEAPAGRIVP